VVKEGMVEVKQVSPDARHNLALTERELVVGQVTRQSIAAGEQVLRNKIADGPQAVGFSNNIPQGKRTVASSQGDKAKPFVSVTLLQNIQVLAVAEKSEPTIQTSGKSGDKDSSEASEAKSVTLALTPEQAEKIFLVEEIGVLRLALRPFGDDEQRRIAPVANDLPSIVGQ
jgi:pilus assembly protein CpaB